MPTFTYTSQVSANDAITAAATNSPLNDISTFLNTTKLDADNLQDGAVTSRKFAPDIETATKSADQAGIISSATDITTTTLSLTINATSDVLISGVVSIKRTAGTDPVIILIKRGTTTIASFNFSELTDNVFNSCAFNWVDTSVAAASVQYKLTLDPSSSTFTVGGTTYKTQITAWVVKT